jgi:hypothetical protein
VNVRGRREEGRGGGMLCQKLRFRLPRRRQFRQYKVVTRARVFYYQGSVASDNSQSIAALVAVTS